MQKCWSLYNKEEKLRIDDLRIDQVRTILLAIPTRSMHDWFACQEGDLRWQSLLEIADFYEDTRQAKGQLKAEAKAEPQSKVTEDSPRRPLFEDAPDDGELSTLTMQVGPVQERRSARRYVRSLEFCLGSFRTETLDISMSGLSLKTPLPAGVAKNFVGELHLNGEVVKVQCAKIDGHRLKLLKADSWDAIRQWIVKW